MGARKRVAELVGVPTEVMEALESDTRAKHTRAGLAPAGRQDFVCASGTWKEWSRSEFWKARKKE